jgi:hypothetical protein
MASPRKLEFRETLLQVEMVFFDRGFFVGFAEHIMAAELDKGTKMFAQMQIAMQQNLLKEIIVVLEFLQAELITVKVLVAFPPFAAQA